MKNSKYRPELSIYQVNTHICNICNILYVIIQVIHVFDPVFTPVHALFLKGDFSSKN